VKPKPYLILIILLIITNCSNNENSLLEPSKIILSGIVIDAQLTPVSGVKIFTVPTSQVKYTDQLGKFEFIDINPGNYSIHAEKDGYLSEIKDVVLKDTVKVQIMLRNLTNISGKILDDSTGNPLDNVIISIPSLGYQTVTKSDGTYSISNIPVGTNIIYLKRIYYSYTHKELYVKYNEKSDYDFSISRLTEIPLISVEGGKFKMGDTFGDGNFPEKPAHDVNLSSFLISRYEVTQKQWIDTLGTNSSKQWGDNLPVESISWMDAIQFCNSRSELEGLKPSYIISGNSITCDFTANGYRLPTEAEWEYSARGGIKTGNTKYSGSSDPKEVAWFYNNSNNITHIVGTKKANELGIHDMSGNVWEFCWDYYSDSYYSISPENNPLGPSQGEFRSLRGGSWTDDMAFNKVYYRSYYGPRQRGSNVGFRIVRGNN
jgi:formylglycine-generating enzyme required for sulfatase activity